jgi:hypothetical protein
MSGMFEGNNKRKDHQHSASHRAVKNHKIKVTFETTEEPTHPETGY